jgi:hypothetical protein
MLDLPPGPQSGGMTVRLQSRPHPQIMPDSRRATGKLEPRVATQSVRPSSLGQQARGP